MIHGLFSIKDSAMRGYIAPMAFQTHEMAIRAFADHCRQEGTPANKHPMDFELVHLGEWDDSTGQVQNAIPTTVARARDYTAKPAGEA